MLILGCGPVQPRPQLAVVCGFGRSGSECLDQVQRHVEIGNRESTLAPLLDLPEQRSKRLAADAEYHGLTTRAEAVHSGGQLIDLGVQAVSGLSHIGYLVGSVVYWRPDGVVHRKVPSGSWSTCHRGCCLSR
jgi:hypothetical protein